MVTTPNLVITHVEQSQANKETTINTALDRLDESANDSVDVVTTAGGTITLTEVQRLDNKLIRLTGSPGGAYNLDVPDGNRSLDFENASGQTATIDTVSGAAAPIALADNETVQIDVYGVEMALVGAIGDGTGGAAGGASAFGAKTEYIPAAAMQPSVTKPCSALVAVEGTAGRPNIHVRDFDDGVAVTFEEAQFQFVFPNRWNKGTITFQAFYSHAGTQTGGLDGVAWGLAAVQIADDAAWDTAVGTEIIVTLDRADGGDVHETAESAAVTIAGTLVDGSMCFFILRRKTDDGADDMDIDARLLGIRLFWTEDAAVDD